VTDADLGILVVDTQPPFSDAARYDTESVRAYRRSLAGADAPAVGLRPAGAWDEVEPGLAGDLVPVSRLRQGPVRAQVTTWAIPARQVLVQEWHFVADEPVAEWAYRVGGPVHLTRAALTQLTEGGVIALPAVTARLVVEHGICVVTSSATPRAVALAGLPAGQPLTLEGAGPLDLAVEGRLTFDAGEVRTLRLVWAVGDTPESAAALARRPVDVPRPRAQPAAGGLPAVLSRARAYVLGCCALDVGGAVCLLTDHRILPLSWTRDAYWVARMLLDDGDPESLDVVRRHLRWLFEIADRPGAAWGRAHLPNGRVKDPAFQLDQQCYPLLELAEYVIETGDGRTGQRLGPHVPAVLELLANRRDGGLYPTQETPADDPLPLPFHCSSHLLLAHTLRRLATASAALDLDPAPLQAEADRLAVVIRERFTLAEGRLAYAVDGWGRHLDYHDANDLPTAFAPLWGLCAADDAVWRATMAFAFSPANPAWAPGAHGGLGSVHTPGAWPLGDVQEYVVARLEGNDGRANAVLDRIVGTACADGALVEARDPDTGAVRSRHWFAWPGAALAVALARCEPGAH